MKYSKVFVLSMFVALFSSFQSFATNPESNTDELRKELMELVEDIDLSSMDVSTERVGIQFVINANNEIIVLLVEDSPIASQIKAKLDHKTIESKGAQINQIYTLPITFQKK